MTPHINRLTKFKQWILRLFFILKNLLLTALIVSLLSVIVFKYLPVYYTPQMCADLLKQAWHGQRPHIEHAWKPMSEMSQNCIQAVVASEDYLFVVHKGFDFDNENIRLNRGARALYRQHNTISEQTACNVFLWHREGYIRNGLEMYFTILLEWIWGKERILEVYLNTTRIGKGIYGVESASQQYYAHAADSVTATEAAGIAACLVNPEHLNPAQPSVYLLRRQAKILGIMEDMIIIKF
ncbi:MAG: monofunctional biosynthetic peptidoglycan transglycosylase [Candidatus Symbiothrix sp.]|jgi:monofunctional biosynthetic peptidoglycan transglycosylase|nr:monofunctional biosynthetic peptidoglycan transglycosylase [Candidatus Symbiothrix sp.]